jgi:hypothetical protein
MSDTLENTTSITDRAAPETSGTGQLTIAQANLYLLLAKAFSLPGGLDSRLANDLEALIPDLPASLQGSVAAFASNWRQETDDSKMLALAFSRLFLGPFEILAPPYASFYLEENQKVMGAVSQWVAAHYAEVGLQPGEGPREVPDQKNGSTPFSGSTGSTCCSGFRRSQTPFERPGSTRSIHLLLMCWTN